MESSSNTPSPSRPRPLWRRLTLLGGLAFAGLGVALFVASFFLEKAYLNGNAGAQAWARWFQPEGSPLLYPGYDYDLNSAAIQLGNAGIGVFFVGLCLVLVAITTTLRRGGAAPTAPTPSS